MVEKYNHNTYSILMRKVLFLRYDKNTNVNPSYSITQLLP